VSVLAFRLRVRQTRSVEERASEAGSQMESELDEIQARLRSLKRRLDAREKVIEVDAADASAMATGDALSMNPLTARPDE
jgi:hypothetical protein